jgi:hypothetical protein
VALTFVTTVCSSAAISLPGVLILPISQEFGWGRGDISGAIALMFVLFGVVAPFAGAVMQRFGLRQVVATAVLLAAAALLGVTQITAKWHLWPDAWHRRRNHRHGIVRHRRQSLVHPAPGPRHGSSHRRLRDRPAHVSAVGRLACVQSRLANRWCVRAAARHLARSPSSLRWPC